MIYKTVQDASVAMKNLQFEEDLGDPNFVSIDFYLPKEYLHKGFTLKKFDSPNNLVSLLKAVLEKQNEKVLPPVKISEFECPNYLATI